MSGHYLPAGFESYKRKDYFESDGDSDDGLNDIVYPTLPPVIKVSPVTEESKVVQNSPSTSDNLDGNQSKSPSTEGELEEENNRSKREYSVNRYDPENGDKSEENGNDQKEKQVKENEKNDKDFQISWFNDDPPTSSTNSLSPDPSQNRETRSPSPGMLLMEDVRLATINGDLDYIKQQMSIDHGFFIDTVLKNGWTILMFACDFGFTHIVQYCLDLNSDPNFHFDGFTPLMAACQSFYADEDKVLSIVELLIKSGAMVDSKDLSSKTALMYACETGKSEVALYLVESGANLSLKDNKHWTCLHFAARRGFGPVVRNMIDYGAKLNVYNNKGESPADLAFESGFHELGTLMERLKAKEPISIEEEGILMKSEGKKTTEKSYETYYLTDMQYFLKELGLYHLDNFFVEQKIQYSDLICFNENDFDELPIRNYGEKLKLWEGIKKVHKRNWQPSRISYLKRKSQISCIEAHVIMCNISNHLHFMNKTFQYLRNHLANDPEFIKRGVEKTNVHKLYDQAKRTLEDGGISLNTLKSFIQEMDKKALISNGCDNNTKKNQSNGKKSIDATSTQSTQKSVSYQKVAMITSGLLGIGALVYFQRDSITSFLPKK